MGEKITVDLQTFYDLAKTKAREDIVKDYVKSGLYIDPEILKIILGIREERGE